METLLDKIAEGDTDWRKVVGDFIIVSSKMLNVLKEEMEK